MKTDWENFRQLKSGEVIEVSDHELSPEADCDGWANVAVCRVGSPASDPLCHGHMKYRRRINGGGNAGTGYAASRSETGPPPPISKQRGNVSPAKP